MLTPLYNLGKLNIKCTSHDEKEQCWTTKGLCHAVTTYTPKLTILEPNHKFTLRQLVALHRTCPISTINGYYTPADNNNNNNNNNNNTITRNLDDEWRYLADQLSTHSATPITLMTLIRTIETSVTPQGFAQLARFTSLTQLHVLNPQYSHNFSNIHLTDEMLQALAPLSHLTKLWLEQCRNVTDAGIAFLSHTFLEMEDLYLYNVLSITDESWSSFAIMTRLKKLELRNSHHLTHAGLLTFVQQASHTFREAHHQRALSTCDVLPQPALRLTIACCPPPNNNIQLASVNSPTAYPSLCNVPHMSSLCSFLDLIPHAHRKTTLYSILSSHIYPISNLYLQPCHCETSGCKAPWKKEEESESEAEQESDLESEGVRARVRRGVIIIIRSGDIIMMMMRERIICIVTITVVA